MTAKLSTSTTLSEFEAAGHARVEAQGMDVVTASALLISTLVAAWLFTCWVC